MNEPANEEVICSEQNATNGTLGRERMRVSHLHAICLTSWRPNVARWHMNLWHAQPSRMSGASGHSGRRHAHHGSSRARTGTIAVVDLESQRGGRGEIHAEQLPLRCRAVQTSRTHADPPCQGAASCCVGGPLHPSLSSGCHNIVNKPRTRLSYTQSAS